MTLFGVLAVLPALVSGNMLIHEVGRLCRDWKAVFINAVALMVSVGFIAGAVWQWL